MNKLFRKSSVIMILVCAGLLLFISGAQAGPFDLDSDGVAQQSAAEIEAYWTPEKMKNAKPMPMPTMIVGADDSMPEALPESTYPMKYLPGWNPDSGLSQPTEDDIVVINPDDPLYANTAEFQPQHGTKPTDPWSGPYGLYQRWTHFGRYNTFPTRVIGKLFFSFGASNYVCSGTVNNRNMVTTAAHCNHDGASTFATNRLFCPAYYKGAGSGAPFPAYGCWGVSDSKTSAGWIGGGDPDYDYACLIMNTTGTVVANSIGNVTGWALNGSAYQPIIAQGYPQASPFPGYHIITTASAVWYTHDFTAAGQVSSIIGSDQTGGSSGGPWLLAWRHKNAEYPDVDGTNNTDPFAGLTGPHIRGVNSHKRCLTHCNNPTAPGSGGVYWSEQSSPPFLDDSTPATDDFRDIYDVCANFGGT